MDNNDIPASEIAELEAINQQPLGRRLGYYTRKSGPGWLQAAITLGGGSLASSLFLGVILEYKLMWLQPLAMLLGVITLSAIGYVTVTILGLAGFLKKSSKAKADAQLIAED